MARLCARHRRLVLLAAFTIFWNVAVGIPIASADITYLYDELGRLVRVIRDDGEAASYHYDAVGNILRIRRESGVPQTTTAGSVSASSARRASTTTVTVSGSNLGGASVSSSVPGITIQNLRTDLDALTFDLIVSADAPLGPATLTIAGGLGTATVTLAIFPPPPVVQSFTPTFGAPGTTVTIFGQFFDDSAPANNTVFFNGVAGTVQTVMATAITATVPAGATSGPITVRHAGGSGSSTGVFVAGQVAVASVTPTSGTRGSTVHVVVTGSNLFGATLSRPGTLFTNVVASATQVAGDAAVVLDAAREGVITVSNQVTAATIAFPVQPGAPLITGFTPISGAVGDLVTVNGGGFDEVVTTNNAVRFNGVPSDIVSVTPTKITTHVPEGATTGPISVTTPAGAAASAQNFTVVASAPLRLVTNIDAPFSLPISIALRPDGQRAYVVNEDRNSVGVVDTATHTIIATVPVGVFPIHAAVSPDGSRLYVVNLPTQSNADTVSVVDLGTNTVTTTITLSHSNRRGRAFVSPDGRTVLVTHPDQGFVSIVDATTATVVAVVATGTNPVRLAFTPDSARAYVTNNSSSNSVTVIDLVARAVLTTIPANPQPTFALMSPDGSRFYTVDSTTVTVINTATNTVAATIANASGNPATAVMNSAGTRIFVAASFSALVGGAPAVVVVNTETNTVTTALQVTTNSFSSLSGLVLTPDDQRLLVSLGVDAAVAVIDAAANTVIGSVALTGAKPTSGVALADNRHVYIVCESSNTVCLVDLVARTSLDVPIARTGAFTAFLTFTPGGDKGFAKAGFIQELAVAIDPATNTALPNIVIPRAPTRSNPQVVNLVLDRVTGTTLYADNSRQIVFVDTATSAVTGILTTTFSPSRFLLASPDGARLYNVQGGTVSIVNTVNKTELPSFAIGGNSAHALLSSDGARLYVADSTNNVVKIIGTAGPSLLATIPVGTIPIRLAFTAGGQKLLTLNSGSGTVSGTVSVIDLTTNTVTGTITLSGTFFGLSFVAQPNGRQAFVVNRTNNRIDVIDTSLNAVATSITMSPAPDFLALTPDGARLFTVQAQAGAVTAIDATNATVLGSLAFPVRTNGLGEPVFAPNGRLYIPRRDFDSVLVLE